MGSTMQLNETDKQNTRHLMLKVQIVMSLHDPNDNKVMGESNLVGEVEIRRDLWDKAGTSERPGIVKSVMSMFLKNALARVRDEARKVAEGAID